MLHGIKIRKNKVMYNPSGQRWVLLIQWLCSTTFCMNVDESLLVYLSIHLFLLLIILRNPQYICIHNVIFLLLGQMLFSCTLLFSPPEKGFGGRGWGEGCPQIFPSSLPYYFWIVSLWIWVWLGTARLSHLQTYLRTMGDRKVAPTSKVWDPQTWHFQGKVLFT